MDCRSRWAHGPHGHALRALRDRLHNRVCIVGGLELGRKFIRINLVHIETQENSLFYNEF